MNTNGMGWLILISLSPWALLGVLWWLR